MSEDIQTTRLPAEMGSTNHFEDLPDDVLVEIFSYLSIEQLVYSVQRVSCRWHSVAQDANLWRKLQCYHTFKETDDEIEKNLQQAPKLRTLILNKRDVSSSVLSTVMDNCSELRKFKLFTSQELSEQFVKSLVLNCQKLEHLTIPSKVLSTLEGAQMIGQLKNLKTLGVDSRGETHSVWLRPIGDGCPSLQHLDIRDQRISTAPLKYFLQHKQDQLQSIKIKWRTHGGKCTIPYFRMCKTLNKVVVTKIHDDDDDAYALGMDGFQALRCMKNVTSLTFCDAYFCDVDNFVSLFFRKGMPQLTELRIGDYPGYGDELAETICNNCPLLKVLCLTDCFGMTNRSLKNLYKLKELEHLSLCPCLEVTDRGMDFVFNDCKGLKYLRLNYCSRLTESCMVKFTGLNLLETLMITNSNVAGLPLNLIPTSLPKLRLLSMIYCKGFDLEGLNQLRGEMPFLVAHAIPVPY